MARSLRTGSASATRRIVVALLTPVRWSPPGLSPGAWRAALAEDVVDLLATLSEVDAGIAMVAADQELAAAVAWPRMPRYAVPRATVGPVLAAAAADGYDQAAVLAADAPDLPGLLVGKLLRPLSTRAVAVAPAIRPPGGPPGGLLGLATRLPAPDWLADVDLDTASVAEVVAASPRRSQVAATPGWRRVRGPEDLRTLDPAQGNLGMVADILSGHGGHAPA